MKILDHDRLKGYTVGRKEAQKLVCITKVNFLFYVIVVLMAIVLFFDKEILSRER